VFSYEIQKCGLAGQDAAAEERTDVYISCRQDIGAKVYFFFITLKPKVE